MDLFDKHRGIAARHDKLLEIGAEPLGLQMDEMISATEAVINGRPTILFGTNNYLGLTFDPACIEAGVEALHSLGTGTTGSRIANGTYRAHRALEREIADFLDKDHALVFPTGYQASLGLIAGMAGPKDTIYLDADSHSCIYDGCLLSGATMVRFRHNDAADLDRRLARNRNTEGAKLVVIESIYSMFGDCAPIADFVSVCKKHDAALLLDEAHAVGAFGPGGQGLAAEQGVLDEVDFIVGTFSKCLGAVGGFGVSSHPMFDVLRYTSRQFMFTAAASPASLATVSEAFRQIKARPELRETLWSNARQAHERLRAAGFDICAEASPIVAVRLGDEAAAVAMWNGLLEAGVYVNLVLPPGAPNGTSLLRCSVSAAHSPEQINRICETFESVATGVGILPAASAEPMAASASVTA